MNIETDSIYKKNDAYTKISNGVVNLASMFLYFGLNNLSSIRGTVSMIIPKSFYSVQSWNKIRNFILDNYILVAVNDVGKAFEKVGLEQGIVIISKLKIINDNTVRVLVNSEVKNNISQKYFFDNKIILTSATKDIFNVINKMESNTILLGSIADMPRGIVEKSNNYSFVMQNGFVQVLGGTNVKQYQITDGNKRKPNRYISGKNVNVISKIDIFSRKRICYQNIMSSLPKVVACIEFENRPTDDTLNNLILHDKSNYTYEFILGILNSIICTFYLKYRLLNCSILTVHLDKPYVGKLPIPTATPAQQQKIITLVDKILAAKKSDSSADTTALESQIDQLVCKLYNLTDEEIKIVEEKK